MRMKSEFSLSDEKLESQARACVDAATTVLWESLGRRRPADRVLGAFLRGHPRFGARDRRLLNDTVFAVLRWWGWLRQAAPPGFMAAVQASNGEPPALPAEVWARIFLAAWLLEAHPVPGVAGLWARQCGLPPERIAPPPDSLSLGDRGLHVFRLFTSGEEAARIADPKTLLPDWAWGSVGKLPCPDPFLIEWLQRRPPIWIRVQGHEPASVLAELRAGGLSAELHPVIPGAIRIDASRVNLYMLKGYRGGAFEVQDLASQAVGEACAASPRERWWDACAGGGGKTLLLAARVREAGAVVASDVRRRKLEDLRRRASRGGFTNITWRGWDGRQPLAPGDVFDGVLVDAPCTGSGTWRRNPDARFRLLPEDVEEMAALQEAILKNAAAAVRPGGVLVYATCSIFSRENAGVVERFLSVQRDFAPEEFRNPLNAEMCPGRLQIWPWDGDCDAMFVARFRRTEDFTRFPAG
jgi:16S rRNA (cytosine967-C5)-methyltransferase